MKTLTVNLNTTPDVLQPIDPLRPDPLPFAGFRLTLTAPSGNSATPPVEQKLTWQFAEMVEGATYKLLVEAVDIDGRVIQSMPSMVLTVPVGADVPTYSRIDGVSIDWI